jgi:rhodanese-related sulfurtransferase
MEGSVEGRIIFLDLEASGLHRTSYPIEVGWAFLDLSAEGFLLRPAPEWTGWDWSFESEKIHGISRIECLRNGIDVRDAAQRLNEALSGGQLYCDSPSFDGNWLRKLFAASGIEPAFDLRLQDALALVRAALAPRGENLWAVEQRLRVVCPRPHRAAADARYLAALYRSAMEPGFLERLEAGERVMPGTRVN